MQARLPHTWTASDDRPHAYARADVTADIAADIFLAHTAANADTAACDAHAVTGCDSNTDAGVNDAGAWKRLFSDCVRGCCDDAAAA